MPIFLSKPIALQYRLVYRFPSTVKVNRVKINCVGGFLTGIVDRPWDGQSNHASITGLIGSEPTNLKDMGYGIVQNSPTSGGAIVMFKDSFTIPLGIDYYFVGVNYDHQTPTQINYRLYAQVSFEDDQQSIRWTSDEVFNIDIFEKVGTYREGVVLD